MLGSFSRGAVASWPLRVTTRLAAETDAHALGVIVHEGLRSAPSADVDRRELASDPVKLGEQLLEATSVTLVVAELDGELCGLARLVPREFARAQHIGDVQLLVLDTARRRGVGRALLRAVRRLVLERGEQQKLAVRAAADDVGLTWLLASEGWRLERRELGALRRNERLHDVKVFAAYLDARIEPVLAEPGDASR